MMLALSFLLLALIGSAAGASSTAIVSLDGLSFDASVNVTTDDARFNYRHTSFTSLLLGATLYTSVDIEASADGDSASAHVDAIVGFCYASLIDDSLPIVSADAPAAWLAYFSADAEVDISNIGLTSSLTGTAALVGKVFTKLEEITPSGEVVASYQLKERAWSQSAVTTAGPNGELKYVTYTSTKNDFDVDITFAVSSVLGKLNVGGATITPRNMESFFEVHNFPYGNDANHVRLTVYLGHLAAKASSTFTGTQTIIAGSGNEQIYFKLSGEAVIDGDSADVTVNGLAKADIDPSDIDNTHFTGSLAAAGDLTAEIRKVTIDFPANAAQISYDPAIGFGAPDSAGSLLPSFGALLLTIAVLFFAF